MEIEVKDKLIEVFFTKIAETDEEQIEIAKEYNSCIKEIFAKNKSKKYRILIDLTKSGRSAKDIPHGAVNIYDEITSHEQTEKLAILGDNKFEEVVLNLLFFKFKARRVNWFTDRRKALLWLGETR